MLSTTNFQPHRPLSVFRVVPLWRYKKHRRRIWFIFLRCVSNTIKIDVFFYLQFRFYPYTVVFAYIQDANLCAILAKRVTVQQKDMQMARRIRGIWGGLG